MELAPTTSMTDRDTPTRPYCAGILWEGSGRKSGETRPSEVESPRWVTSLQLVRSGRAAETVAAAAGLVAGGFALDTAATASEVTPGRAPARVKPPTSSATV